MSMLKSAQRGVCKPNGASALRSPTTRTRGDAFWEIGMLLFIVSFDLG